MTPRVHQDPLRQGLASRRFVITVEVTLPKADHPFDEAIRPILALARAVRDDPRIDAIALTDRSRSDHDHDPIAVAGRVADLCGKMPVVHWAGKDRSTRDLEADLARGRDAGLETFLLVTGDKLRNPPPGRPVRYLDSVNAIYTARRRSPQLLLAAAVCPFKYREEELVNQYLKAVKKLRAGCDVLMTQIGWDPRKFAEAAGFIATRGPRTPLMAELLFLTAARSRRIRAFGLPGVTLTGDLAQRVEEETQSPDRGRAAALRRLALQIAGARDLGYAGVQVSGLVRYDSLVRLLDDIAEVLDVFPTPDARANAWAASLQLRDGRTAAVAPRNGFYLQAAADPAAPAPRPAARAGEWARFRALDLIDRTVFRKGSVGARVLGPLLRRVNPDAAAGRALLRVESAIKGPLLGCQTCGFCRLPHTAYVCPETCPKGLANGPCGGTTDNWCEFGDRECIHNQIYRISKQAGSLANLDEVLIPPVPEQAWDTCSWITEFQDAGPTVTHLKRR